MTSPVVVKGLLRRAAWPLGIGAAVTLLVVLTLLTSGSGSNDPLDPASTGPDGSKALAQVLRTHGQSVQVVRTDAALEAAVTSRPQAEVLVTRTDLLTDDEVTALRDRVAGLGQLLVLVTPSQQLLDQLAPGVQYDGVTPRRTQTPACPAVVPTLAGPADAGGATYRINGTGQDVVCYFTDERASYVVLGGAHPTVVIGQPSMLTNKRLAKGGNASLMVGTLGQRSGLIWFVPPGDIGVGQRSLTSVLPRWVPWFTGALVLVVVVCMLWRGRRLGRLVPEPLPVVVRSVETTEGRARMYRRARAQGRAGAILREAALDQLRARSGLARSARPDEVVAVVATRTGIPGADVAAMLLGPPPRTDDELLQLARRLDLLTGELDPHLDREALRR